MALDQQSNWDADMADNLRQVTSKHKQKSQPSIATSSAPPTPFKPWTKPPIYLPDEILLQIASYLRNQQASLASCAVLSQQWYSATVPLLYAHPNLHGPNFAPFVAAICPSINLHVRPSRLAKLVKTLDMRRMVHEVSRTSTARLLGRTKENLEAFVAPQASFGLNCLPALSKCQHLRALDLSLVSESPPLTELFRTLERLGELRTLRLPRSAGFGVHSKRAETAALVWPPKLEDLSLSGGIDAHFLHGVVAFPQTLKALTIEHCPLAKGFAVVHLLKTAVRKLRKLEKLKIAHMPRLSSRALDDILFLLPQIRDLSVSVDYITPALFDEGHYSHLAKEPYNTFSHLAQAFDPNPGSLLDSEDFTAEAEMETPSLKTHALRTLTLTSSGNTGLEDKISPIDILIALDEGSLPNLRVVRAAKALHWHSNATSADAEALADGLKEAAKRTYLRESGKDEIEMVEGEHQPWEEGVGVWVIEG
ncbi:hypothetical protein LTR15_009271 [Elasticomyces elasticus]|nr:hypothetical protein LTR15_009271 [Elasticomyces elasticus]